jgi:hypothetical protein
VPTVQGGVCTTSAADAIMEIDPALLGAVGHCFHVFNRDDFTADTIATATKSLSGLAANAYCNFFSNPYLVYGVPLPGSEGAADVASAIAAMGAGAPPAAQAVAGGRVILDNRTRMGQIVLLKAVAQAMAIETGEHCTCEQETPCVASHRPAPAKGVAAPAMPASAASAASSAGAGVGAGAGADSSANAGAGAGVGAGAGAGRRCACAPCTELARQMVGMGCSCPSPPFVHMATCPYHGAGPS